MTVARIALSLALGVNLSQALAAQPGGAPADEIRTPAERFAPHPYKSAMDTLANYQSCGMHARAADLAALTAELRSIESLARAKGLGPTLERLRQDYLDLLAISSRVACAGGATAALANARRAMADFRTWVADQPAR